MKKYLLILPCLLFASLLLAQPPNCDDMIICGGEPLLENLAEVRAYIGNPIIAQQVGIKGEVIFRILFDTEGCYVKHKCTRVVHPILQQACEPWLSLLFIKPPLDYCTQKPTTYWLNVSFRFK